MLGMELLLISGGGVKTPSITHRTLDAIKHFVADITYYGTYFESTNSNDTLIQTEWQIGATGIHEDWDETKIQWDNNPKIQEGSSTTYTVTRTDGMLWARVRYHGSVSGWSDWSEPFGHYDWWSS